MLFNNFTSLLHVIYKYKVSHKNDLDLTFQMYEYALCFETYTL